MNYPSLSELSVNACFVTVSVEFCDTPYGRVPAAHRWSPKNEVKLPYPPDSWLPKT